ncbi:NUDIX domain-containing protein [Actinoplanes sp. NPDC051859]|uniref:NUDIX hydrolase n=1 Tax=Actinoplanes sp. NPDC051859 TaxID=3363909 RepID=UPI00379F87E0
MTDTVRAAGGVLWRPAGDGIEICVVHRPYRSDWSLPKGKLDGSEHPVAAAVREVQEETGVHGEPLVRLPDVAYSLPNGAPKTVEWWWMRAGDGPVGAPQDPTEVDEVVWLAPAAALARLTYPDDRRTVEHGVNLPPVTALTVLIRHAHAGNRKDYGGDDALRPIDDRGRTEAETISAAAALFGPRLLIAATPLRCRQTFEPLAARLGLPIVSDSAFAEPGDPADGPARVKAAAARLVELRAGRRTAVCSQGKVIPGLLALLAGAEDPAPYKTPKGDGWVLTWSGDQLVALSRI